ncbi:protein RDM16-like isoform X2 [Rhododendron vialii]|uniref:protein RDM16-like isoform X2 n=1 Tax=Rhododendron vialii TaxID=182163 RepID=UPI00265DFAEE|nr:protein RDM16-like isoform X2 [Rhododendron vialii]
MPCDSLRKRLLHCNHQIWHQGLDLRHFWPLAIPLLPSTDGTASAGTVGNLSLDALSEVKRALQKVLAEKQKQIPVGASSEGSPQVGSKECLKVSSSTPGLLPKAVSASNYEAVKYSQELAAKLGFPQDGEFPPLGNIFLGQMPTGITYQTKLDKAHILRVDALGREIDEHGKVVDTTKATNLCTLKVNLNKEKKEAFPHLGPEIDVDPGRNDHFDARIVTNSRRPRRTNFEFVEEGTWSKAAEIIKLKSQFGEAQAKELKAKQTQLAKADPGGNPNLIEVAQRVSINEKSKEPIPEIEWWDRFLLFSGTYADITDGNTAEDKLNMEKITIYMEHPTNLPPTEPGPPLPQLLKLTKEEQRKLRKRQRQAQEAYKQAMIAQALLEPPKPIVKMSNLMRVLGCEATQDPTRLEMEIRRAAIEREKAHDDRNAAHKLTPDERREKRERKLFGDPDVPESVVSVYKVNNDLSHPQTQFKVNVNAHENRLTGCAVTSEGISIVVVEGGKKSTKRYQNLMLRRIDWASAGGIGDEDEGKTVDKCLLVWEGSVAKPSFDKFCIHKCRTEAAARKVFSDVGVPHYWDLAFSFTFDHM